MRSPKSALTLAVVVVVTMALHALVPRHRPDWVLIVTGPVFLAVVAIAAIVSARRRSAVALAATGLVRATIGLALVVLDALQCRFMQVGVGREMLVVVILAVASTVLLVRRNDAPPKLPRFAVPVMIVLAIAGVAATVMHASQPKWGWGWVQLDPPGERMEEPMVLEALDLSPGLEVADFGAGGGYYTFRIAEEVGPDGGVSAYDVDFDMVSLIWVRARRAGFDNVRARHSRGEGQRLEQERFDRILLVNVYTLNTCDDGRQVGETLSNLAGSLAPGGKLIVYVDWILEWPDRGCRQMTAGELQAATAPMLSTVRVTQAANRAPDHVPGYLIVLQKPLEG